MRGTCGFEAPLARYHPGRTFAGCMAIFCTGYSLDVHVFTQSVLAHAALVQIAKAFHLQSGRVDIDEAVQAVKSNGSFVDAVCQG